MRNRFFHLSKCMVEVVVVYYYKQREKLEPSLRWREWEEKATKNGAAKNNPKHYWASAHKTPLPLPLPRRSERGRGLLMRVKNETTADTTQFSLSLIWLSTNIVQIRANKFAYTYCIKRFTFCQPHLRCQLSDVSWRIFTLWGPFESKFIFKYSLTALSPKVDFKPQVYKILANLRLTFKSGPKFENPSRNIGD